MVLAVLVVAVDPFATGERRKLPGDSLSGGLVTDDAVLGVKSLTDNLRVNRSCRSLRSASGPTHRVTLVHIATESAAVKGQIEASDKEGEHERSDKPGRKGRPVGVATAFILVLVMIVMHGWSYLVAPEPLSFFFTGASGNE